MRRRCSEGWLKDLRKQCSLCTAASCKNAHTYIPSIPSSLSVGLIPKRSFHPLSGMEPSSKASVAYNFLFVCAHKASCYWYQNWKYVKLVGHFNTHWSLKHFVLIKSLVCTFLKLDIFHFIVSYITQRNPFGHFSDKPFAPDRAIPWQTQNINVKFWDEILGKTKTFPKMQNCDSNWFFAGDEIPSSTSTPLVWQKMFHRYITVCGPNMLVYRSPSEHLPDWGLCLLSIPAAAGSHTNVTISHFIQGEQSERLSN